MIIINDNNFMLRSLHKPNCFESNRIFYTCGVKSAIIIVILIISIVIIVVIF